VTGIDRLHPGGKTEAAVFPMLTAMIDNGWRGLSVLYVCPLRAQLNNLHPWLDGYARRAGTAVPARAPPHQTVLSRYPKRSSTRSHAVDRALGTSHHPVVCQQRRQGDRQPRRGRPRRVSATPQSAA
jgi:hypothetical protein